MKRHYICKSYRYNLPFQKQCPGEQSRLFVRFSLEALCRKLMVYALQYCDQNHRNSVKPIVSENRENHQNYVE